jgi:hypothetical protein
MRSILIIAVALLGRGHQRRVHDLTRHRDVALLMELPVECLHHALQRASFNHPVAKVPDRVLIGHRTAKVETKEPHPGQPVTDHEFHLRIREIVLSLHDQYLEHRNRIKGRTTALGTTAIAKLNQPAAKIVEIHRAFQHFQRIAIPAQTFKVSFRENRLSGFIAVRATTQSQSVNQCQVAICSR